MQKPVSFRSVKGRILRGMIHLPVRVKNPPLVVFCHGFTGSGTESSFLFVRLSRFLEKKGVASLRFDFYGSGESDGRFDEMTFSGECRDLEAVLRWNGRTRPSGRGPVYLLGLSMGGAVASVTAPRIKKGSLAGLILLNPASNMKLLAVDRTRDSRQRVPGGWDWMGLKLGLGFIKELLKRDLLAEAAGYGGPVLLVVSQKDTAVPPQWSLQYKKIYGGNVSVEKLKNADHTFQSLSDRAVLEERIARWIKRGGRKV